MPDPPVLPLVPLPEPLPLPEVEAVVMYAHGMVVHLSHSDGMNQKIAADLFGVDELVWGTRLQSIEVLLFPNSKMKAFVLRNRVRLDINTKAQRGHNIRVRGPLIVWRQVTCQDVSTQMVNPQSIPIPLNPQEMKEEAIPTIFLSPNHRIFPPQSYFSQ